MLQLMKCLLLSYSPVSVCLLLLLTCMISYALIALKNQLKSFPLMDNRMYMIISFCYYLVVEFYK